MLVFIVFLSTPSARRATVIQPLIEPLKCDFYPRPPRGGRRTAPRHQPCSHQFLSTPSARRATSGKSGGSSSGSGISIHALREEGDVLAQRRGAALDDFYPRPPRGGRHVGQSISRFTSGISIHALREEGDDVNGLVGGAFIGFLSTPSARRATGKRTLQEVAQYIFLSTPSARRATKAIELKFGTNVTFLSTPSARRATTNTTQNARK